MQNDIDDLIHAAQNIHTTLLVLTPPERDLVLSFVEGAFEQKRAPRETFADTIVRILPTFIAGMNDVLQTQGGLEGCMPNIPFPTTGPIIDPASFAPAPPKPVGKSRAKKPASKPAAKKAAAKPAAKKVHVKKTAPKKAPAA